MSLWGNIKSWVGLESGRRAHEPKRESITYPRATGFGFSTAQRKAYALPKMSPANLRYFSHQPYTRRAINSIKNPIAGLPWEIVPIDGVDWTPALKVQAKIVTNCLKRPNCDDSWRTFVEQLVEDILVVSAGCYEQRLGGNPLNPLWLWPMDGSSVQIYAGWAGNPDERRYLQTIGYSNIGMYQGETFTDSEVVYLRPSPSTQTPYSVGAVETAFQNISRILGVAEYAGNVSANASPEFLMYFPGADDGFINRLRGYWRDEVEGQGNMPIVGGNNKPETVELRSHGDDALYLKYQEMLLRELSAAFDLSPQNLNLERDVNRSQGEVAQDRDWEQAVKPNATLVSSYITQKTIQGLMNFPLLQHRFIGLERMDEDAVAKRFETYYKCNLFTPNDWLSKLGLPPSTSIWADKHWIDCQIALAAARGAKEVDDPELPRAPADGPKPTKGKSKPPGKNSPNQE